MGVILPHGTGMRFSCSQQLTVTTTYLHYIVPAMVIPLGSSSLQNAFFYSLQVDPSLILVTELTATCEQYLSNHLAALLWGRGEECGGGGGGREQSRRIGSKGGMREGKEGWWTDGGSNEFGGMATSSIIVESISAPSLTDCHLLC